MNLYTDSSALMRRYLSRPGSAETDAVLATSTRAATVVITRVEVAGALHRLEKGGAISKSSRDAAVTQLESDLSIFTEIAIGSPLIDEAFRIAQHHALKGYDAVQLGAAVIWKAVLGEPVTVATFDAHLWAAASAEGLEVWPPDLSVFK